ncbi:MerR family transcriptional regulator [Magnetospirillum molischianum]|uniref:Predicted transcriptional regulator n=1 Tax=Magnetospirillum molischianum DSM 120 TaxID=1150626 RepID=H8FUW3_MAGML|nr:MerR family transcriptional regulator [Magnetospirillum molischianum]CCG42151.1 Predicted transcriptional regulator [Magnetospirillum molischianum DSM 120]
MIEDEGDLSQGRRSGKSETAFRTISEVADELEVPQHVLRFWEGRFPQVRPLKRGGGRRYYRPEDVALLRRIRDLLYREGYTIKGVQKLLKESGSAQAGIDPFPDAVRPLSFTSDEEDVGEEVDEDIAVSGVPERRPVPVVSSVAPRTPISGPVSAPAVVSSVTTSQVAVRPSAPVEPAVRGLDSDVRVALLDILAELEVLRGLLHRR